eukprot:2259063-Prymnesium_polylepis.1
MHVRTPRHEQRRRRHPAVERRKVERRHAAVCQHLQLCAMIQEQRDAVRVVPLCGTVQRRPTRAGSLAVHVGAPLEQERDGLRVAARRGVVERRLANLLRLDVAVGLVQARPQRGDVPNLGGVVHGLLRARQAPLQAV